MNIETCKACALKHLSDALQWLQDAEKPTIVRNAYISGNLSHASGHLLELSEEAANKVRETRLNFFDADLQLKPSVTDATAELERTIATVSVLVKEPPQSPVTDSKSGGVYITNSLTKKSSGCGCGKKR